MVYNIPYGAVMPFPCDNVVYRKLCVLHGKAVCEQQGVTSNKEFKEDKEIKKKTNDCTQNRADEERCRDCPTDTECGQSYARAVIYV